MVPDANATNSDTYSYIYANSDGYVHSHSNTYLYANSDSDSNCHCHCNRSRTSFSDTDSDDYSHTHTDANAAPHAAALEALNATNAIATSFTANWRSVTGATGYRLDASTNKSFTTYVPGYQNLDVGNTTSYTVSGLSANTNYYYRLRAYNGNGTSPNSNVINAKTARH